MPDTPDRLKAALAGRYTIERELGRGGMAVVYLATDLKHQRPVAIKVLKPELAAALGPDRFLREIAVTARLEHPRILPLYDSGCTRGPEQDAAAEQPPVAPDNHLEYSRCRVTLGLRKPEEVGHAEVGVADSSVAVDKWSPLEQLDKTFHRSYRVGTWQLRLRLWTRELPSTFSQGYAAVIEVIDDTGTKPVFRETDAAVGQTFRHISVRVAA